MNNCKKLLTCIILIGLLLSSCGPPRQLASYDDSYIDEQKYIHQPTVINDFESLRLVKRNHTKIAFLSYPAIASAVSIATLASGVSLASSLFAGLYFPLPIPFITALILAQEGRTTRQYRDSLDELSLNEIEQVLINSPKFLYHTDSNLIDPDSIYKLNLHLNYSYVNSGGSRIKIDNPQLRISWNIMSPQGEPVATITTVNQFFSNDPQTVEVRNPDFKDAYVELAKQSAESFLAVLDGVPGTHIPTDPYAHKKRTDANIVSSEFIRTKRNRSNSKQQYSVVINKGLAAGYQENDTYDVVKKVDSKADYQYYFEKPVWDRQRMLRIGKIHIIKAEDDYAEGTITLFRRHSKPEDYDFSDELVRMYWAY